MNIYLVEELSTTELVEVNGGGVGDAAELAGRIFIHNLVFVCAPGFYVTQMIKNHVL